MAGDDPYLVGAPKIIRGGVLAWRDIIYAAMRPQSMNALGQAGLLIGRDRIVRADAPASEEKIAMDDDVGRRQLPGAAQAALDEMGGGVRKCSSRIWRRRTSR